MTRPLGLEMLAAGEFRRTQAERDDQRLSWERSDRAFFAAGACHILAWAITELYAERELAIGSIRRVGVEQVFHTYATWNGWTFDHSGWHRYPVILEANEAYDGGPLESIRIEDDLPTFCARHHHRMPEGYWLNPSSRARRYVAQFSMPWEAVELADDH